MYYERDGLEPVNPDDKHAARVIKRFKSERLYGKNDETPKYAQHFFAFMAIGVMALVCGAFIIFAAVTLGLSMMVAGAVACIPYGIYLYLTDINEMRLAKLVRTGRIAYYSQTIHQ